jgi:general secretion pathway protein A
MYLKFFSLNKEPFQITPDPSFLYLSPGHREALASIIYGVEKSKGFILIIGAVGVGKTTILRAYLEKAQKEKLRTIYLFNANISYRYLLQHIFRELNVVPVSDEISEMVNQLHQVLINEYREGRNVLLLIDEAQNMPVDTLENLRMLSNLETTTDKLLQIVFSAQPEFEKTLNLEELRQLKQRIAVKAVISPLSREEGLGYIYHRLRTAAGKNTVIFSRLALREIVRVAKGIPRIINVLCDNCLITAFGYGRKKVGVRIVKEIVRDMGMQKPASVKWPAAVLVTSLLAIAVFWGVKEENPARKAAVSPAQTEKVRSAGVASSSAEKAKTEVAVEKGAVDRIVEKGDTLAKLIKDVYGHVDSKMIRFVKKANPAIYDENLIVEGGRIIFPARKDK